MGFIPRTGLSTQPVEQARHGGFVGHDIFADSPLFRTISRKARALRESTTGVSVIDHDPGDELQR